MRYKYFVGSKRLSVLIGLRRFRLVLFTTIVVSEMMETLLNAQSQNIKSLLGVELKNN